jgi:O-antigen ligase
MRSLRLIPVLLIFALLPFELPVAEGLHGLLRPVIGETYFFLFCGTWLALVSFVIICSRFGRFRAGWEQFSFYALLFAIPAVLAILTTAISQSGDLQLSFQQLVFGYAAPSLACLALFSMSNFDEKRVWLAFYIGWCVFLAGSLAFLFISWRAALDQSSFFAELSPGQKLFAWRYTFGETWNLYSVYVGNANKESNYLLIFLLLSARLLGVERIQTPGLTRRVYFTFWALATFTICILFSRAALFLFPFIVYSSGFWKRLHTAFKWTIAGTISVTLSLGYASYSAVFAYLLTSQYLDNASEGALGTFNDRFSQWRQLYEYLLNDKAAILMGLGTGGYGVRFFGDSIRGTHNMFLDTLLESGLIGFVALMIVMLLAAIHCFDLKRLRIKNTTCLVALIALILLMFREHSASYLYVTSLGGMCFTVIFYLLSDSQKAEKLPSYAEDRSWTIQ